VPFALLLDVLIAILLIATIAYAVMLNRRLADLRKDQTQLEKLSNRFNDATVRAEESINRLTGSADEMKRDIMNTMRKAEELHEDLTFLIERAGHSADKLEGAVRNHRPEKPAYTGQKVKDTLSNPTPSPQKAKSPSPAAKAPPPPREEPPARPAYTEPAFQEEEDFKPKTDAERELLKALESVQ